jgi:hypothetical protein
MAERATDTMIVRNLLDALNRLHDDLDRVELWVGVLRSFQESAPEYQQPGGDYILPTRGPGPAY